jgi:hypothetical protein
LCCILDFKSILAALRLRVPNDTPLIKMELAFKLREVRGKSRRDKEKNPELGDNTWLIRVYFYNP